MTGETARPPNRSPRRAAQGDAAALATLDRHADRLARALANVVNLIDPEVIVLGGGLSNLPGLADTLQAKLSDWAFTDEVMTRVVRNRMATAPACAARPGYGRRGSLP
jgi:fructokinase